MVFKYPIDLLFRIRQKHHWELVKILLQIFASRFASSIVYKIYPSLAENG